MMSTVKDRFAFSGSDCVGHDDDDDDDGDDQVQLNTIWQKSFLRARAQLWLKMATTTETPRGNGCSLGVSTVCKYQSQWC